MILEKSICSNDDKTNKRVALFVATLTSFLNPFMGSSINIALPLIGNEFKMDTILLTWVPTSFLLAVTIFLLPFGKLGDIYGKKKLFMIGILIYTIASFLSAVSTNSIIFIVYRVFQGIGAAMMSGTGVAILTTVFSAGERGKALGINTAAVYLGLSLGPFIGGVLTHYWGWRSIFIINIPLGLLSFFMTLTMLKVDLEGTKGEKFDLTSTLIYGTSLVCLMYGFSVLPKTYGIILIAAGLLGILFFILLQSKVNTPLLNINLFKNRVFAFSNLSALISYSATFSVGFLLSLYLQYIKNLTPQEAGFILVSQPIIMAVFSPLAGRLSDKIEPRIVASIGMSLTAIGVLLLIFITKHTSTYFIILPLILMGFGYAFFSSPNTNAVMSSVEKKCYGVAAGTLGTMRVIGQIFSMGLTTLTFALFIGRQQITAQYYPQFVNSLKFIFVISAVLCILGTFSSLVRGKVR